MKSKRGFTLLEISIVLLVMGLIVGGIIAGTHMIRSSKIQSMIVEQQRFKDAISQFRDKYMALPGDFAGASSLWASTADGDGNGMLTVWNSTPANNETYLLWKHLAKSGLIEGNFTGAATASTWTAGVNTPASKLGDNTHWIVFFNNTSTVGEYMDSSLSTEPHNHILYLSNELNAAISGAEGKLIDLKIDDGLSSTGKVGAGSAGEWDADNQQITSTLFINTEF